MILLLIGAFFIILLLDLPALLLKKQSRELVVFLILWSVGLAMCFLLTIGIKLPSPAKGAEAIINLFLGQ